MSAIRVPKYPHPQGDRVHPTWTLTILADGRPAANVTCWFGHVLNLASHHVLPSGEIAPGEVKCPHNGCPFKARLRLIGWGLTK